jgi:hypothetical protein
MDVQGDSEASQKDCILSILCKMGRIAHKANKPLNGRSNRRSNDSHIEVVRPFAALRHNPNNVLVWVFDVTGFAMDSILVVNMEARRLALFH